MHGVVDAMHAEAMAIVFGLDVAWERGFVNLQLESDASVVINEINRLGPSCWVGGYLIDEIRHLSSYFDACHFSFIKREANGLAHALSKFMLLRENIVIWVGHLPASICNPDYFRE